MKILIAEDTGSKRIKIVDYLKSLGVKDAQIVTAETLADFAAKMSKDITICVIDLRMPAYEGATEDRNGIGILQIVERSGSTGMKLLAISSYPGEFEAIRPEFERRGCMLVDFGSELVWQSILKQMVIQECEKEEYDFLIFAALRSERAPYSGFPHISPSPSFKDNISRFDVDLHGRKGAIIEMPRMGIVDAAAMVARCIEVFSPRVIGMSGICAGIPGRAELGQLLIAELAYEYQSGKWTEDGFSQEPYQSPASETVRSIALEILEDGRVLSRLEEGWSNARPSQQTLPKLATFTSGSAVIADRTYMEQVAGYHRRVSGLDMEVYAVLRAAQISRCKPDVICAKTVVDLGDKNKNDEMHPYGCFISARFLLEAVGKFFLRSESQ